MKGNCITKMYLSKRNFNLSKSNFIKIFIRVCGYCYIII